jgi:hypothetical protein
MGICQCIEANNVCLTNEIYSEKRFHTDEDKGENSKLVKGIKNKVKDSNFNNFTRNKRHTRKQLTESSRSEILFEDISFISKTNETFIMDQYQNSKQVFDFINNIRLNPEKCLNSLYTLINELNPQEINGIEEANEKEILNSQNTYLSNGIMTNNTLSSYINENVKIYFKDPNTYKSLIELRDFFTNLIKSGVRKADLIMWSEKVYLTAYEYLVEVEEKLIIDSEIARDPSSIRVSKKLKSNHGCQEFNVNGLLPPEITVLYLLLQNKDRIKTILLDNYDHGAVCSFPTKNNYKLRTLIYLVKRNTKINKVSGTNPLTNKPHDLFLFDSVFDKIIYKNQIVDGSYSSNGKVLKVIFSLISGEKREEIFSLS